MHLAGVLADGVLPSLTLESLERSYAPKALGVGGRDMQETLNGLEWNRKFEGYPSLTLNVEVRLPFLP